MSVIALVVFMVLITIPLERAVVKPALQGNEDGTQFLVFSLLAVADRDRQEPSFTLSDRGYSLPKLTATAKKHRPGRHGRDNSVERGQAQARQGF